MACTLGTYSLQLLQKVDYIIMVSDGGTRAELITSGGPFSNFVTEFVTEPEDSPKELPALDVGSEKNLCQNGKHPNPSHGNLHTNGHAGWRDLEAVSAGVCRDRTFLFPSLTWIFLAAHRDCLGWLT